MKFRFGFTKSTVGIESSHRLLGADPRLHSECPGAKLISACVLSLFSSVQLFATPWTVACQPPLSMGFSRQKYWGGLSCHPPGDLPKPGIEPESLVSPALAGGLFTTSATWEAQVYSRCYANVSHPTCSLKFPSQGLQTLQSRASKRPWCLRKRW